MTVPRNNNDIRYDNRYRRRRSGNPMVVSLFLCSTGLALLLSFAASLANPVEAFGVSPCSPSKISRSLALLGNNLSSSCCSSKYHPRRETLAARFPSRCGTSSSSATSLAAEGREGNEPSPPPPQQEKAYKYTIRDCQYRELTQVAGIVVESFYDKKNINAVARKLYQLAETNRLQQNFPYPESRTVHRMLVVEATNDSAGVGADAAGSTIVGFCDVDARPCATKLKLPRPYLSDLAVDPNHRRRGLARMLVEAAEEFVRGGSSEISKPPLDELTRVLVEAVDEFAQGDNETNGKPPLDELWIRVASDNAAALGLYRDKLGYSLAEWSTGEETKSPFNKNNDDEPEVLTLRKDFRN